MGPSRHHWVNYTPDKLESAFFKYRAVAKGIEMHALAKECIRLGVRLQKVKKTLNLYVNDAIQYRMTPEQPLYYSCNCFGTADAISFERGLLRVHDLKTGESPASMQQLKIYAALFCLEYQVDPFSIEMDLRIYQNDVVLVCKDANEEVNEIMGKIIINDEHIEKIKARM
jgi:hypothetical protein